MKKQIDTKPNIVCIGGGTGTFVVLKGLKFHPCNLSAIVTMSDSGGSNKRIRDEFGLLPTSDIRQCLVALSDENGGAGVMRKLFMYRYSKGRGIAGMTFGNLFMAALSDILGSQAEAIKHTRAVLNISGDVIPVSYTSTDLKAEYEDGSHTTEEHLIDEPGDDNRDGRLKINRVWLEPHPKANPDAVDAIMHADLIIIGPGDVYTSIIPNFLVDGIPEAIEKTKAKKVYVLNLMTKWGQTYNFTARDHVHTIEQYMGMPFDYVLVNNTPIQKKALDVYAKQQELPVVDDLPKESEYTIIRRSLASDEIAKKHASDALVRSLIRHDSEKLAKAIVSITESL